LNIPNGVFSANATEDTSKDLAAAAGDVKDKGFAPQIGFKQLEAAAQTPQMRDEFTGQSVRLVGKFVGEDSTRFTLARFQINCCSADAIPLKAVVLVDPNSKERQNVKSLKDKWVQVTGQVQFQSRPLPNNPSKVEYVPVVVVVPKSGEPGHALKDLVKVISPPANPYVD
jgi:uncharacterized membrane protein YcgQ (UPF0703/DUF1980 family)